MTCRHGSNDPNCSSYRTPEEEIRILQGKLAEQRKLLGDPDNSQFEIVDCLELTSGVVLRVKYESCTNCAYEGTKVLVYVGSTTRDVLKWRTIDPHFREVEPGPKQAPSPTARFPASQEGWDMAVAFLAGVSR